jgi:hypothetical protein
VIKVINSLKAENRQLLMSLAELSSRLAKLQAPGDLNVDVSDADGSWTASER